MVISPSTIFNTGSEIGVVTQHTYVTVSVIDITKAIKIQAEILLEKKRQIII
jgi:hypothetical protein